MRTNDITPAEFDSIADGSDLVWSAKAIGKLIDRSGDYVRDTLANLPGSPVRRIGRRYCVSRRALAEFFRA